MKKSLIFAFLLLCSSLLFAAYNSLGIPDSAEIRQGLLESWFQAPIESLRAKIPEIYTNDIGQKFQVRMEEGESTFNIFVSPQNKINVDVYTDSGIKIEEQYVYPGDAQGAFVVIRDKASGKTLRIRYYFLKNSEVYIQFSPYGKLALTDLIIFGNYAARGVSTGIPFERYYYSSFQEVMKTTKNVLPWDYVLANPDDYHSIQQMIAVIKEKLPLILFTEDAMYDEYNQLVQISNGKTFESQSDLQNQNENKKLFLSSAGFVKWIADGLVEPIAGSQLKREPLITETVKVKDTGYQGILSQKYSLFFALDWIRNLASALVSVYSGQTYLFSNSGVDVNINPFASAITETGVENIVTFIENSGYTIEVLKSMLYVLAATEPGTFYFGAIRGTDRTVKPEVMAFNECVAFFPYFLNDGAFDCAVFMNGRQMTLENFCMYYPDTFVYLTRVKSSENFFPQ
ncbi:MAG: hypothetical protein K5866_07005 [Treponema sp.]|nr:hypothetical protein [Treponema sp.]